MKEEEKHFEEQIIVKSDLHEKSVLRNIKDGDIYWCALVKEVATILKKDLAVENCLSYLYFFY